MRAAKAAPSGSEAGGGVASVEAAAAARLAPLDAPHRGGLAHPSAAAAASACQSSAADAAGKSREAMARPVTCKAATKPAARRAAWSAAT
jgi:hypothetical protein